MRYYGIDILRGLAAFGIVGCHLVLSPRTEGGSLITSLCDFNVGLFAAIAGFLMCGVTDMQGFMLYASKRTLRIIPTYFLWSLLYLFSIAIFDLILDGGHINERYYEVQFWRSVLFWGGSSPHLWFLPSLFYAQLAVIFLLGIFNRPLHGVVWVVAGGILLCCGVRMGNWYGIYPLRLLSFLLTGYGIGVIVRPLIGHLSAFLFHLMALAFLALFLYVWFGDRICSFYRDWLVLFPTLVAFSVMDIKNKKVMSIASFLAETSMGVFLVHPLFTRALSYLISRWACPPYSASMIAFEWLASWGMAITLVLFLRRISLLRKFI